MAKTVYKHSGSSYSSGMILPHGPTGGVIQVVVVNWKVGFIVKCLNAWYNKHFWSYELENRGNDLVFIVIEPSELSDIFPLTAHTVAGKHHIYLAWRAEHCRFVCSDPQTPWNVGRIYIQAFSNAILLVRQERCLPFELKGYWCSYYKEAMRLLIMLKTYNFVPYKYLKPLCPTVAYTVFYVHFFSPKRFCEIKQKPSRYLVTTIIFEHFVKNNVKRAKSRMLLCVQLCVW